MSTVAKVLTVKDTFLSELPTQELNDKQTIGTIARCVSLNLAAGAIYIVLLMLVAGVLAFVVTGLARPLSYSSNITAVALGVLYVIAVVLAYFCGRKLPAIGQPAPSLLARQKTHLFVTTSGIMWLPIGFLFLSGPLELLEFISIYGAYIVGQTKILRRIESALEEQLLRPAPEPPFLEPPD